MKIQSIKICVLIRHTFSECWVKMYVTIENQIPSRKTNMHTALKFVILEIVGKNITLRRVRK